MRGKDAMKGLRNVLLISAVALFLLGGCGYRFSGEGEGPLPGLQNIAIPVFENATSEPDLGAIFAGELRRTFLQKGKMKIVPLEQAQAVFRGRVTNIYTSAVAHRDLNTTDKNQLTIEARLYVTLNVRCIEVKTGRVLWQDPSYTYFKVFRQSAGNNNPNPIVGFDNRRDTVEFLAKEMSIRIHDRFLSDF